MVAHMSYRPYAPPKTVIAALRRLRRRSLPDRLDAKALIEQGHSAAIAARVAKTLRFLGLVDQYYEPRADLRELAQSSDAEFGKLLEKLLRRAYSDIFQLADPSKHTQSEIIAAFRRYEPRSQHYRMAILFLGLCREAAIPIQEQLHLKASRGDTRLPKDATTRPRRSRSQGKPAAPAKDSPILWASFARLPKPGIVFPAREQEAWLEGMRNALRLEYRDEEETTDDGGAPGTPPSS